jgi:hypothetical protein
MSGNDRVRFCQHCRLSVNDLSRLTRREATRLVAGSGGRLCVRYVRLPNGSVLSVDTPPAQLYQIARRASRLAAGAFSAALSLGASVAAQAQTTPADPAADRPEAASTQRPGREATAEPAPTVQEGRTEGLSKAWVETVTMGVMIVVEPSEPLVKAAFNDDLAEMEKLLSQGTDANVLDRRMDTTALEQAVSHANLKMVKALLDAGADINAEDRAGRTALMTLDEDATPDLVRALLDAGADVKARDDEGNSALAHAAAGSNAEVVRRLLDAGAKINLRNEEGRTALMLAAEAGELENVRALVAAGADYNLKDEEGQTALDLAREGLHEEVTALLVAHGAVEGDKQKEEDEEEADEEDEEP